MRFRITYIYPGQGLRRTHHDSMNWDMLISDLRSNQVYGKNGTSVYLDDVVNIQLVASVDDDDVD